MDKGLKLEKSLTLDRQNLGHFGAAVFTANHLTDRPTDKQNSTGK